MSGECGDNAIKVFKESYFTLAKRQYFFHQRGPRFRQETVSISLIVLSFLPLITNLLAVVVLTRSRVRRHNKTLQQHLLLLTIAELAYSFALVNFFLLELIFYRLHCGDSCLLIFYIIAACTEATQGTRNWMVGAITAARCDVILRPVSSLHHKLITTNRLKAFLVFILLLSILLSALERFYEGFFVVCHYARDPLANNVTKTVSARPSDMTKVRQILFLLYLRLLPIIVVVVCNFAIIIKLLNRKQINVQSQEKARAAAKTVTAIATVFMVCEGFGCTIYTVLPSLHIKMPQETQVMLQNLDKYLLLINSLSNFVTFVLCHEAFRNELHFCNRWSSIRDWTVRKVQEVTTTNNTT